MPPTSEAYKDSGPYKDSWPYKDGWSPPPSRAYKTGGTESAKIIPGGRGGNGARSVEELPALPASPDDASETATGDEAGGEEEEARRPGQRVIRAVVEWALVIGGALLIAFLVKTFLVQAFWIPSPSMRETLVENDRVLVNKLADTLDDLHRGDVIVFKRPEDGNPEPQHTEGQIEDLIKRVVGLPGDELEARDGALFVNGQKLDEPYVSDNTPTNDMDEVTVPEGHVFVMGDNRTNSQDSRVFGPVPEDDIVGRAFLRVWPLSHIGRL